MTPADLIARVEELDKAATSGPWINDCRAAQFGAGYTFGHDSAMVADRCPNCEGVRIRGVGGNLPQEQNAALIAEYRTLAPALAADLGSLLAFIDGSTHSIKTLDDAKQSIRGLRERVMFTQGYEAIATAVRELQTENTRLTGYFDGSEGDCGVGAVMWLRNEAHLLRTQVETLTREKQALQHDADEAEKLEAEHCPEDQSWLDTLLAARRERDEARVIARRWHKRADCRHVEGAHKVDGKRIASWPADPS